MRKLALVVVLACAAVGLTAASPPPVDDLLLAQAKCGNDMCAGSKSVRWRFGGNVSIASPDGGFSVDGEGDVTAPSLNVTGASSYAGVQSFATVKTAVLDAGQIFAQGFGPITRIIPFTTAAIDFAAGTIVCEDSAGTTAAGARVGDPCHVGMPETLTAGGTGLHHSFTCYVSAANTIKVRACAAGTADNPGSVVFQGFVISSAQ